MSGSYKGPQALELFLFHSWGLFTRNTSRGIMSMWQARVILSFSPLTIFHILFHRRNSVPLLDFKIIYCGCFSYTKKTEQKYRSYLSSLKVLLLNRCTSCTDSSPRFFVQHIIASSGAQYLPKMDVIELIKSVLRPYELPHTFWLVPKWRGVCHLVIWKIKVYQDTKKLMKIN